MQRQGDLLFVAVDEIPQDAVIDDSGIIARGEVTGHTHRIRAGQQAALMLAAGMAYVRANRETVIEHEEHAEVILPPGLFIVKRQREYRPEGWVRVAD